MRLSILWLVVVCLCGAQGVFGQEITSGKPDGSMINVLIVDGQNNHNWRETTPVLKRNLEETGLFYVEVATSPDKGQDMSAFRPAFSEYDVVVMNYNGDSWSEGTKADFEAYVANGGGLVIYHAANNAFPEWKEYNLMCGVGGWGNRDERSGPYLYWQDGRPVLDNSPGRGGSHGPQHEFVISVCDTVHPILKDFPPRFMHKSDELYDRLRGPAQNVNILAVAYSDTAKGGTGRFEPQLMTISYKSGRVFHIAYGHAGKQCRSVAFIVPFLRGTQWAATGVVTIPIPEDIPTEEKAYARP
ncbi:MAG: ThuA domain-containing protein [Planctomycetia bacterium]|nr:ThuA domain-containing protein [Planctomycetia bacterium]